MEKDPEMDVLGYKQLTITAKYTDKKKDALPYLLEKCIRYFMAYLFCTTPIH